MVLPNQLTTLRILLTPVFLYLFLTGDPVLIRISFVVFIIAAITDWYDGWLARKFNYITNWGKFMDPLADKILTSAAFFGFVFIDILALWMVIVIVARDLIVTLLRIYADYRRIKFTTTRLAKIKTFSQMIFLYYLLLVYTFSTFPELVSDYHSLFSFLLDSSLIYWTMFVITIFTAYSGLNYLFINSKLIRKLFNSET
ncbi:MAG: CDP-diacylglycerol--glycerol-3-phosphate 3-phosphatidyltransferase [Melioribacteraceae bacterium]|nr:CDP-diacylglycerol--glycerol-3-phosphate 3-phosphatidyltransferase [Melioribacteraceae bacterium]WKZ68092.1 MAG: CDP-diacylglycerol--glycerol-3-phosphate 3-phosphatidyltransferase [Melioribacteraceae bacterium]